MKIPLKPWEQEHMYLIENNQVSYYSSMSIVDTFITI